MKNETYQKTTNSRVYRILKFRKELHGCPICGPHSGCNSYRKRPNKSWKNYKNKQYGY